MLLNAQRRDFGEERRFIWVYVAVGVHQLFDRLDHLALKTVGEPFEHLETSELEPADDELC